MGIFPPACRAAASLAGSNGGDGLMVATSKAGFVWAKAAMAVSARPIVNFLNIRRISF
jgi:NAD(P)H-hydrate repair Nnr-like enzyme with NAD(P)H-hydrate epimerase domain